MVEFFENIFNWFVTNKDEVVLFFTSSSFAAFISNIVLMVKQIKATKNSNKTVNGLSDALNSANELALNVANVSDFSSKSVSNTEELKVKVNDLEKKFVDSLDILQQKLDAMIEVQRIVYSNLKDDSVRKNVSNILTTAKLAETAARAQLEKEIEELRKSVANKANDLTTAVENAASKVKKVVSVKKSNVSRY